MALPLRCRHLSHLFQLALLLVLAVALQACSGSGKMKPTELEPNVPLMGVRNVWAARIGTVDFPLTVKVKDHLVVVASSDGIVGAIDARTGGDVWRVALGVPLSAGVGSDGRFAAVVSRENELITLDAGKELWRHKLGAVTLTPPLIAGSRVFVLSADRSVVAFDAVTGRKLWQQQRTGDALVLGRPGILLAFGDTLVAGLGGRLVGMNPLSGKSRWETPIASSRGTNEVERLVDLVAGVSRVGNQLCARAFQSAVACVDGAKGSVIWSKSASGFTGVDGDETDVFGSEGDGKVLAWRRSDGEPLWVSERLRFRGLSAPLLVGRSVVVGDGSGIVHFLSRTDGTALNRMNTDGSPIVVAPVLAGSTLIVVTQRGGIYGFRPE
ncbi:MAG: outer membrane protein assembly factor BamB [Rhodoferax sp.]|nr:outer membrane protein assembly factor BamB [Rhodoferax sp.]